MSDFVRVDRFDQVVVLTLNRPERRNSIATIDDCDALVEALDQANANPAVTVLILTGSGSAFCSGGDRRAIQDRSGIAATNGPPEDTRRNYRRGVQRVIRTLAELEIATIAAINGPAVGLGLDLALLCDMRIGIFGTQMASSFVKLGLIPGDGGAWILTRIAGPTRAAELILTGDSITSERALEFGLLNELVPANELMDAARQLASRVSCNSPRAVRMAKRLLIQSRGSRLTEVLELSAALQALAHETQEHRDALHSALSQRPPQSSSD